MKRFVSVAAVAATSMLASVSPIGSVHAASGQYSPGASDTEIKIGHTTAYSGPVSAFGAGGRVLSAYFKMVNESGGVNGRRVGFISLDDAYSPPKAVEQTRRLVEEFGVLMITSVSGSPTNASTQKYLNSKGIPQVLISTGAAKFNNPQAFPWTMPFWPTYSLEQKTYVDYIAKAKPGAKIGVLYANDDYGKDHLAGVKTAVAANPGVSIVAEVPYETSDATVDSQMIRLKASGADTFISARTPKFAAQAIRKAKELGWSPMQFVANASNSVSAVLIPAGVENSTGVMTAAYLKVPGDPKWAQDKGVNDYLDFMKKWAPQENPQDLYAISSYANATMLHHVLKSCGNDLTRENVMKQVSNIHDIHLSMHLPKIALKTTPQDFAAFQSLQLQRFDGSRWVDVD